MKFTIEQLEKIISEAPEGAEYYTPGYEAEYRKITGRNVYYGFVGDEWMEVIDNSLSIERINKLANSEKFDENINKISTKISRN